MTDGGLHPVDCGGRWARQTPPCATAVSQQWPRSRHCSQSSGTPLDRSCRNPFRHALCWTEISIACWTEIPISVPSRADSHPHPCRMSPAERTTGKGFPVQRPHGRRMRNGYRESIDREGILGRADPTACWTEIPYVFSVQDSGSGTFCRLLVADESRRTEPTCPNRTANGIWAKRARPQHAEHVRRQAARGTRCLMGTVPFGSRRQE